MKAEDESEQSYNAKDAVRDYECPQGCENPTFIEGKQNKKIQVLVWS